jgi:hypothetical protein
MELDHSARGTSTHILVDVAILLRLIDSMDRQVLICHHQQDILAFL